MRMPNGPQLKGQVRQQRAAAISVSSNEMHMRALGTMSHLECDAGNKTAYQTPAVFRQAAYEWRVGERLHQDVVMELDIAKRCWNQPCQVRTCMDTSSS